MSPFRPMAAILPMALLAACGGGSGGAPTATETLPDPLITDTEQARALVEGDIPRPTSHQEIQNTLIRIIAQADTILFSEITSAPGKPETSRMIDCTQHGTCSGKIGDGTGTHRVEYSVNNRFLEPLRINEMVLPGYREQHSMVMVENRIPLMQTRGAGDTLAWRFEHQSYGGWLRYSAFTIRSERMSPIDNSGNPDIPFLLAHSLGKTSPGNPGASATWEGVMVGATKDYSHIIQGNAAIEFVVDTPDAVSVTFDHMQNFDTHGQAATTRMAWPSVPLENGVFTAADDSIRGHFYGDNHEEVGGIFDRDGIVGAFGAAEVTP